MLTRNILDVLLRGFFGAGLASLGFAVLFNIRERALWYASLAGGVGGIVYNFCALSLGMEVALANFFGSVALTICAEIFARKLKMTMTTFVACAMIPLVPGGGAYRMMMAFLDGKISLGMQLFLQTMTIAGMLALGILVVSAMSRFYFFSARKVKNVTRKQMDHFSD